MSSQKEAESRFHDRSRIVRSIEQVVVSCQNLLDALSGDDLERPEQQYIPITNLDALRRAGVEYPNTVNSWRWIYRKRHENGLADAFRTIGRRILVNPSRFLDLTRARAG